MNGKVLDIEDLVKREDGLDEPSRLSKDTVTCRQKKNKQPCCQEELCLQSFVPGKVFCNLHYFT